MGQPRQVANDWYATRWAVLERDQFACRYCGQFAPNVMLHVDHILAVCEGGTDDLDNLVTACSACNIGKEMYRANAARSQQRKGARVHRPLQGTPSIDPAILTALGDHPEGLTARQIAALVDRDRSTLVRVLVRLMEAGKITRETIRVTNNPTMLYRLANSVVAP